MPIHLCFCFQAEDGIRDLVRSRGLGDVYKRQLTTHPTSRNGSHLSLTRKTQSDEVIEAIGKQSDGCLLYTSDAADERSSVDLGGRRIIKKNTTLTV